MQQERMIPPPERPAAHEPADPRHAAWVQCLAEIQAHTWRRTARGHHGSYMPLDVLYSEAAPILAQHGFAVSSEFRYSDGRPVVRVVVHSSVGPYLTQDCEGPALTMPPNGTVQATCFEWGKARTYLLRYALATLLGIAAEDDAEAGRPRAIHKPLPQRQAAARRHSEPPRTPAEPTLTLNEYKLQVVAKCREAGIAKANSGLVAGELARRYRMPWPMATAEEYASLIRRMQPADIRRAWLSVDPYRQVTLYPKLKGLGVDEEHYERLLTRLATDHELTWPAHSTDQKNALEAVLTEDEVRPLLGVLEAEDADLADERYGAVSY